MVENLVLYYENLIQSMDRRRASSVKNGSSKLKSEESSSKVKKILNDFTEIKRPSGKSKTSLDVNRSYSTLPKTTKGNQSEIIYGNSKITKSKEKSEFSRTLSKRKVKSKENEVKVEVNVEKENSLIDIEEKIEEFGEKLRQRRSQPPRDSISDDVDNKTEETNEATTSDGIYNHDKQENEYCDNDINENYDVYEETGEGSDDIFGFNDFDEDCNDNYVIEAYNKRGEELVIVTLEITRRSLIRDDNEEIENLINNSDIVVELNQEKHNTENIQIPTTSDISQENANSENIICDEIENIDELGESINKEELISNESNDSNELKESTSREESIISNEVESFNEDDDDHIYETLLEYPKEYRMSMKYLKYYDTDENDDSDRENGDNFFHNLHRPLSEISTPTDTQIDINDKILSNEASNSNKTERKEKINFVIEELIKTEEIYINGLKIIVEKYMPYICKHVPRDLLGKQTYLFGNIEIIYRDAKKFLQELKRNSKSADDIAFVFMNWAQTFELYPQYSKNKPTADIYLKEFDEIIKRRERQLEDKLGLASYLLTPIQRLGKYVLMLESIEKELYKSDRLADSITAAISVIKKVMRKGNDFIAIDSITQCKIDLTMQGSFIMRANFNILKPKKFLSMVFLFENVIVFTQKLAKNLERFVYVDSIQMSDLSMAKFEEKPNIFHLTDYPKSKKGHHEAVTYVLEAETPKIKNDWTNAIERKLWDQLENAKEQQKKQNSDEGKRLSQVTLPGSPTKHYPDKNGRKSTLKSKSTFYKIS